MRIRLSLPVLLAGLLCWHGPAAAQTHLTGTVLDDATQRPVAAATIELSEPSGRIRHRVQSDPDGRFVFARIPAGTYHITAARIGYQASRRLPLTLARSDTVRVEIRISTAAVLMAPLEIVAAARQPAVHPGLEEFEFRRQRNAGTFITREEIETRNATNTLDLLSGTGVRISGKLVTVGRTGCYMMVYIDGAAMTTITGRNRVESGRDPRTALLSVLPVDIEAMEIYRGAAQIPPEFGGATGQCGAIAIWTRGATARRSP
jgi:hypothetical protein